MSAHHITCDKMDYLTKQLVHVCASISIESEFCDWCGDFLPFYNDVDTDFPRDLMAHLREYPVLQMTMLLMHPKWSIFFAPSAVRPNSPVTVEQKEDPSPFQAKSPSEAGADDRIPPSQECSPHPGRKQQNSKKANPKKPNRQKW